MGPNAQRWLTPGLGAGILLAAGLVFSNVWNPPAGIRITFGFLAFFLLPGWLFHELVFPSRRFHWLERLPLALPATLGVFAFPALLAFRLKLSLAVVLSLFSAILLVLLSAVVFQALSAARRSGGDVESASLGAGTLAGVLVPTLGIAVLAYFLQAFRGLSLDWDYFNYISQVRKLVDDFAATNAHFAYADAPADPIHSYNLWALLWALLSAFGRVEPVALYLNAAFLTAPLAGLAFFTLARRLLDPSAALSAFFLFLAYHLIYGGMTFLGATTFFPEDSMWLLAYPGLLALLCDCLKNAGKAAAVSLALAVLGVSIVHVLWGLAFYLSTAVWLVGWGLSRSGLAAQVKTFLTRGPIGERLALVGLPAVPLLLALAWTARFGRQEDPDWFEPLLKLPFSVPLWTYYLIFLVLPLWFFWRWLWPGAAGRRVRPELSAGEPPLLRRGLGLLILTLVISLPYIVLRWEAIQVTQWHTFGRNPYRAFLTENLFFLNPFRFTWTDPNLTAYPLYLLGLSALPLFLGPSRKQWRLLLPLSLLPAVILLAWYAPAGTLFAQLFSLGYLRRSLRIIGLLSFLPAGFLVARLWSRLASLEKRAGRFLPGVIGSAVLLALAAIPWPAKPVYYNHLFAKMMNLLRSAPRDSLLYDETPFRVIKERSLAKPGEVIFSDVFTSFRLTAYLNAYVAVQQKPGVGVPDQDQRRLEEVEFFQAATPPWRRRQLLDRYRAGLVIINRDPAYQIYNYSCGHPEILGQLKQDSEHFTLLYDEGEWAIFRYHGR